MQSLRLKPRRANLNVLNKFPNGIAAAVGGDIVLIKTMYY